MIEPSVVVSSQLVSVALSNQRTLTSNPAFGVGADRTPQIIFAPVTIFVLFHYDLEVKSLPKGLFRFQRLSFR